MSNAKRRTLIYLLMACFLAAFSGVLITCLPNLLSVITLAMCLATIAYNGCLLFFFSDDWHRVREERRAIWWGKHRILVFCLWILLFIALTCMTFWRRH